jgi:hypothetical protein
MKAAMEAEPYSLQDLSSFANLGRFKAATDDGPYTLQDLSQCAKLEKAESSHGCWTLFFAGLVPVCKAWRGWKKQWMLNVDLCRISPSVQSLKRMKEVIDAEL